MPRVTEKAKARKRTDDRERYNANKEARREYGRNYYHAHREAILRRRRETGLMKYGTAGYERRKNNGTDADARADAQVAQ